MNGESDDDISLCVSMLYIFIFHTRYNNNNIIFQTTTGPVNIELKADRSFYPVMLNLCKNHLFFCVSRILFWFLHPSLLSLCRSLFIFCVYLFYISCRYGQHRVCSNAFILFLINEWMSRQKISESVFGCGRS